jgi:hypothetical protein
VGFRQSLPQSSSPSIFFLSTLVSTIVVSYNSFGWVLTPLQVSKVVSPK